MPSYGPADSYHPEAGSSTTASGVARVQRAASNGHTMSHSAFSHRVGSPQLQSQPSATLRESPSSPTLFTPLPSARCPSRDVRHEGVQAARRSSRESNTEALEAAAEHITQRRRSVTHSSTCSSPSLPKLSLPSSPLSLALSPGISSRSASPFQNSRACIDAASRGHTRFCSQSAMISWSDFVFGSVSTNQATTGQKVSERIPRINVCCLPFKNLPFLAQQRSLSQVKGHSGSHPRLSDSTEDTWHGVMSGASSTLVQLAKDLLGEHAFPSKASCLERELRRTHRPHSDAAAAADDAEMSDVACDNVDDSCVEGRHGMDRAFDEVASQKANVLDGITLPDAARRFFVASFLFLRDSHAEFSFWTDLHKAHHQLVQLFSLMRYTEETHTTAVHLTKKHSDNMLPEKILNEEQAVSESSPQLSASQFVGKPFLETESPARHIQGSRTVRVQQGMNKHETSSSHLLKHRLTTDIETRDMMQLDDTSEAQSGAGSRSASQSFDDTTETASPGFPRASSFQHDHLYNSENEEDETYFIARLSGEGARSIELQTSEFEADEESVGSCDVDRSSDRIGIRSGISSTGTSARGCGERSGTMSYGKLPHSPLDGLGRFDAVLAQLKSASKTSRTSLNVLRSELISTQAITEGSLLTIIFQVLNSSSPPTTPAIVLPLVASAYVLILASLLQARKRCCQLLVACCHSLCGVLEHQRYKAGQADRETQHWHTASAALKRQMELLDISTLKLTSSFVADANVAFLNVLAIVYPFASVLHAHRLRRRQARERAQERRLVTRGMQLDSLAMKCRNALADIKLREGKLRQRLAAAMRSQQKAASRIEDLKISIATLRKQELKLQSRARASSNGDPRRTLGLQVKLEQLLKQRQQQEKELAAVSSKFGQARVLVEAIQEEQQQSTEARCRLQQERVALQNERKIIQRMSTESNEHSVHHRPDVLGGSDGIAGSHAAGGSCRLVFQDERRDAEGLLRCTAELTQLVVQALKFHKNGDTRCNPGSASTRSADSALLSKAYSQYMVRIVNENDFRHTLLSCTPSESMETEADCIDLSESEASFHNDDQSVSLQRGSGGTMCKFAELAIPVVNSCTLESIGMENIKARTGESKRAIGETQVESFREIDDIHSFGSSPPLKIRGSERTPVCGVLKHTAVRDCEGPNIDPKRISHLLQEPLLIARLTAMQVMSAATSAPLSHITGTAWKLMDELLAAYDETHSTD